MQEIKKQEPDEDLPLICITLIEEGAENWITAGKAISDLLKQDKDAYKTLMALRPWITPALLHTLERIGRGEVYPYAMLERNAVAKWLLSYSYKEQKRACVEGVDVVLYVKDGKPFYQRKTISNLTSSDIHRVFGATSIRTVEEQRPFVTMSSELLSIEKPVSKTDSEMGNANHAISKPGAGHVGYYLIAMHNGKPVLEKCDSQCGFAIPIIIENCGKSKPFEIIFQ